MYIRAEQQQHENTKSVDVDEDKTSETSTTPKQFINELHTNTAAYGT